MNTALLADMDKAITEMEVALAMIKPEFRAAQAAASLAAAVGPSSKPSHGAKKKEDKRQRKERKDRERVERRALREEAKAADLLKVGKTPKSKPSPARHHSDPAIAGLPPMPTELGTLVTAPLAVASGSGDLLSPASAETGRPRSGTVSSSSGKHKGLRGIFRKTSSGSHTAPPLPATRSADLHAPPHSPFDAPSSPHGQDLLQQPLSPLDPPPSPAASRLGHISFPVTAPPPSPAPSKYAKRASRAPAYSTSPSVLADLCPAIDQLDSSLNALRAMHSSLLDEARRAAAADTPPALSDFDRYRLSTVDREASEAGTVRGSDQVDGLAPLGGPSSDGARVRALRTHHRAASTSSRLSSVLSIWYDAEVMPEVDEPLDVAALAAVGLPGDESSSDSDEGEYEDVAAEHGALSPPAMPRTAVYERSNSISASSDSTASSPALSAGSSSSASSRSGATRHSFETARPEDSVERHEDGGNAAAPVTVDTPDVQWRTRLPVPMPKDEGSLISVLRKSVGKDMSQISMPVTFNEPISLLQRSAEDIEYANLLTLAAHSLDPAERLAHVAAFAVSSYAGSRYRSSRKPFNPMLGETFELVRDGVRFVAEKTSHHPPVIASHADGPGWAMWQTSAAKNKLAGMSLEITPVGATFVVLDRTGERFTWTKPSSYIRNLVAGTKYVETIGTMEVLNLANDDSCRITFKEGGWGGGGRNVVSGVVTDGATGKKVAFIDGKWDSRLEIKYGPHDPASLLWQTRPWPADADKYYGWTHFTLALNQLDRSFADLLPTSDSRFNPAQRALEEGDVDRAEHAKLALETRQRARNRAREQRGESWTPRFFRPVGDGFEYKGGYWEARQNGTFEDLDLW